jgi:hypothetical protein
MAKGTSRRPGRKGAEQTPVPAPAPTWQQVFAELAYLWRFSLAEQSAADRDAWSLLWAGAKHFGMPIGREGDLVDDGARLAAKILRGSDTDRNALDVLRCIDAALAGPKDATFDGASRILCTYFQRPETDAPLLATMLANVIEPKRQGRPPAGKFTRQMIVEWVIGKRWNTPRAAKLLGRK